MRVARNVAAFAGVFAFSAICFGLVSAPELSDQVRQERFWVRKAVAVAPVHLIAMGDSRTAWGISPARLLSELPGSRWRGLNFGFMSGVLTDEMFDEAEARLVETGPRVILLGITPLSLRERSHNNEHFHRARERSALDEYMLMEHPLIRSAIPLTLSASPNPFNEYHDDGWVASAVPFRSQSEKLIQRYRAIFEVEKVSPHLVCQLLKRTRQWTDAGVHVFAFRPPVSDEMRRIEDEESGMDYATLTAGIESAGAHWIDIDHAHFHAYDGSHLAADEAQKLSALIGAEIARLLQADPVELTGGSGDWPARPGRRL